MDKTKQIELIRKRNSDLSKQIEELKSKIDFDSKYNSESTKKAKNLIIEMEQMREEMAHVLDDIQQKRNEYENLISTLKDMKKIMEEPMKYSKKVPWYKKIIRNMKNN